MLTVACVLRKGGKVGYDSSWVDKLKNSVERNLDIPYKFVCLSDTEVSCDRIPLIDNGSGFWSKLELFRPNILSGKTLYIDLDTVICQNITPLIEKIENKKFVMLLENGTSIHSSAMMFWNGDYSYLWELYKSKPIEHWKHLYAKPPLYGDQALISENTQHDLIQDYCPHSWFHTASPKDRKNISFEDIKILLFRKPSQKPSTMVNHPLVIAHWK